MRGVWRAACGVLGNPTSPTIGFPLRCSPNSYNLCRNEEVSSTMLQLLQRHVHDYQRYFLLHLQRVQTIRMPATGTVEHSPQAVAAIRRCGGWLLRGIALDLLAMSSEDTPDVAKIRGVLVDLFGRFSSSEGQEQHTSHIPLLELLYSQQLQDPKPGRPPAELVPALDAVSALQGSDVVVDAGGRLLPLYDIELLREQLVAGWGSSDDSAGGIGGASSAGPAHPTNEQLQRLLGWAIQYVRLCWWCCV